MTEPGTLNQLFFGAMDRAAARPVVLRYKHGDHWEAVSGAAFLERVHDVSLGLRELGIGAGDRVAILSENRPEWAFADYACLALRAADVPI
jgi:long-chain acyl-CoA synthetase